MFALAEYTYTSVYAVYERMIAEQNFPPTGLQLLEEVMPQMKQEFAMYIAAYDLYETYGFDDQAAFLAAIRRGEAMQPLSWDELDYIVRTLNLTTYENAHQGVW